MKKRFVRILVDKSPRDLQHHINDFIKGENVHVVETNYSTCYNACDEEEIFSVCLLYEYIKE